MQLSSTVVGKNEGDSYGQKIEAELLLSRTADGVNLVLSTKMAEGATPDPNVEALPMLYLVDNVLYVYQVNEETYETGYIKVPIENNDFIEGSPADVSTMLTGLLAQVTKLLDGHKPTEEQYAEIGNALVELLQIEGNKGSVKLDIKASFDRFCAYFKALDLETKTLRAVLDDALALMDEDLTTAKLLAKLEEYAGLTVTEAMDKIDAWLTKEHGTNLQKIYDEALAKAEVKEMIRAILPILQPGDWDFEEEYAKIAAFRLEKIKENEIGSATLYEVAGYAFLALFATARPTPPAPELNEEPVPYTDEEPSLPALDDLMAEVNAFLDMTLAELVEDFETVSDIIEFLGEMTTGLVIDECYLSADVQFKGAFLLDTLTLKGVFDASYTEDFIDDDNGSTGRMISGYDISATLTLSDISTNTVAITAPTKILN